MAVSSVASDSAFEAFFDLSPTGGILYAPVYNAGGEVVDFTFFQLNQAAQRLLKLPAQPSGPYQTQLPGAHSGGFFAKQRHAFLDDTPAEWAGTYPYEGLADFYRVSMRRMGAYLVASFSLPGPEPHLATAEALRQSQAREQAAHLEADYQRGELQRVLDQAPVAIALLRGPEHVVEFANAHMAQIWNRPVDSLLGYPHFAALPDLAGQGFEAVFDGVFQTGTPHYFRAQRVTINQRGQPYQGYFNMTYQPAYDSQGQITGLIASAVEVTEQLLAHQQVQQLNEELAAINEELRITNDEFLLANTSLHETQLLLRQLNQELETRVTERTQEARLARAEAERQRGRLADLFQRAPAAICIFDGPDWVYEFVNPEYQALFPGRQLLGRPLLDALPEVAGQPLVDILRAVYDTGVPFEGKAVLVPLARTADGPIEDIYFDLTYLARFDAHGRIDGFITYANDVTEQVLARQRVQELNEELAVINEELRITNEELNNTNTQLTRTNVDLDTFVYTASHDLKAPITNIEGILLALRDHLGPAVQQEQVVGHLLDLLQRTVERFRLTINQLTDISKLQLAHAGPAEAVNLAAVVADVHLDLLPALEAAGTQLSVEVAPDVVVVFAPANLRSVVYNLLSNASKYRDPARPSVVQVRAAPTAQGVVLTVQDNGLGLTPQQQERLFGLFQRLHTHVEGTGVGLYILKRLVENAGGTVAVESAEGVGSTFTITFQQ